MTRVYQSANLGPQPDEPLCNGTEEITDATNKAPQTDVAAWHKQLAARNSAHDAAFLKAYPPKK